MLAPPRFLAALATGLASTFALAQPAQAQFGLEVAGHILRRTSYGPKPAQLINLIDLVGDPAAQAVKINQYIDDQLDGDDPDPIVGAADFLFLPSVKVQNPTGGNDWDIDNLARYNLTLALYSENQLRELMTGFWQQHFNTSHGAVAFKLRTQHGLSDTESNRIAAWFEYQQNEGFREHALGSFRELLRVSAEGVAMLIYLDSNNNKKASPNENYARELMELHTLGTDAEGNPNLYLQPDVEEAAKIFTGWFALPDSSGIWTFAYDPNEHSDLPKTMFAHSAEPTFAPPLDIATPSEGRLLLDYLANSEVTAKFVSEKLFAFFISQDPQDTSPGSDYTKLIDDCIAAWTAPNAEIRDVLEVLLKSSRMMSAVDAFSLVERPIEALTSTVRSLDGLILNPDELNFLYNRLRGELGQALFRFPSPDGYSFENFDQISTSQVLYRTRVNAWIDSSYVSNSTGADARVAYNWGPLFAQNSLGLLDPSKEFDMVLFFFLMIHQGLPDPASGSTEFNDALTFLATDDSGLPHNLSLSELWSGPNANPDLYQERIDGVVRYIASLPRSLQK